jgi:pantetheine-phosphate adenylyltransferase
MARIAVYPGSFDPITLGHVDIIHRIAKIFDEVVILISVAPDKNALFSVEEKKHLIQASVRKLKNVRVESYQGLTVNYVKKIGAQVIVRGLRAVVDFEYELSMGNMNKNLAPGIETVLVFASPEYYFVSSRGVKEVAKYGGDLSNLVPKPVAQSLEKKFR